MRGHEDLGFMGVWGLGFGACEGLGLRVRVCEGLGLRVRGW